MKKYLSFLTALTTVSTSAFALPTINGNSVVQQVFTSDNDSLTVSSTGDLSVAGVDAVTTSGGKNLTITVAAASGKGILGATRGINIGNNASLSLLNVTSGRVASGASGVAVSLGSLGAASVVTTTVNVGASGQVIGGNMGIYSTTTQNKNLTINNDQNIQADNQGIVLNDTDGGSVVTINNNTTGLINSLSAAAGSRAITGLATVSGTNSIIINNNGVIQAAAGGDGAIILENGNTSTITNNSTGLISGNITAQNSQITVINSGSIQGNVDLGTNFNSTFFLDAGNVTGNIVSNSVSQVVNLTRGSITGNINNSGKLNFNDTAANIFGNITSQSGSQANLNNFSNTLSASSSLTLNSASNLTTEFGSGSSRGSINVNSLNIASGTTLSVELAEDHEYIPNGAHYTVASGATTSTGVNSVADDNISVNNGTNRYRNFLFTTSAIGSTLFIDIARIKASAIKLVDIASVVYDNIHTIGASATGELRRLQSYLDSGISDSDAVIALKSAGPQNDNGINRNAVNIATMSMRTAEDRLEASRRYPSNFLGFAQGDAQSKAGLWVQAMGSSATQKNVGFSDGYKAKNAGISIGADGEVGEDKRLGLSFSYTNSSIKSAFNLKNTNVNTYQVNLYNTNLFGKAYVDTLIGAAYNQYQSNRSIPVVGVDAKSNYNGQTYVGKIKTGYIQKLSGGFNIIPEFAITYLRNNVSGYKEKNAGTLNLNVQSNSYNFLEGRAGLNLQYDNMLSNGLVLSPTLRASYGYDFINNNPQITSNFMDQTVSFTTSTTKVDRKSLRLGAGFDLFSINSFTASADYIFETKSNYNSHTGIARVRFEF